MDIIFKIDKEKKNKLVKNLIIGFTNLKYFTEGLSVREKINIFNLISTLEEQVKTDNYKYIFNDKDYLEFIGVNYIDGGYEGWN